MKWKLIFKILYQLYQYTNLNILYLKNMKFRNNNPKFIDKYFFK